MKVEIFSDIACPWCYIGEKRFQRALAAFPGAGEVEVVFRPYQLDPNTPETAVPISQYLSTRFGRNVDGMLSQVTTAAAGEGITMDWENALAVNTRTAHRLSRLAEQEFGADTQLALMQKLFEAHFERGVDVSDHSKLVEMAVSVGMDETRVREYLSSDEGMEELEGEFERARASGVTAVPTFVFNGEYAVQGGQPASTFLQVLEEVRSRSSASEGEADAEEAAACADGSCAVPGS